MLREYQYEFNYFLAGTIGPTYTQCASGNFQLVGGSASSEGRVEICLGGNWSTICGYPSTWDNEQAAVMCRQLGFRSSGTILVALVIIVHWKLRVHTYPGAELVYSGIFGQGSGLSVSLNAECTGDETSILQCPSVYHYISYYHTGDIGVRCAPGLYTWSCSCLHLILNCSFIMLKCVSW